MRICVAVHLGLGYLIVCGVGLSLNLKVNHSSRLSGQEITETCPSLFPQCPDCRCVMLHLILQVDPDIMNSHNHARTASTLPVKLVILLPPAGLSFFYPIMFILKRNRISLFSGA